MPKKYNGVGSIKPRTFVYPNNFLREEYYLSLKGDYRYHVYCKCSVCGGEYRGSRDSIKRRKTTKCKSCYISERLQTDYWRNYHSTIMKERAPRGKDHCNWKGGSTSNQRDRNTPIYKEWRATVFARDSYMCKFCLSKKDIVAHHIVPWVDSVKLRFNIENGITLCTNHHKFIHKILKVVKKYKNVV